MAAFNHPPLHPAEVWHGDYDTLPRLFVITVVSNPIRFNARYQLYKEFEHRMQSAGCVLLTVEASFGQRPFALTDANNPHHIQVNTSAELWLKENLINLGVQRLEAIYPQWDKVAWVDADIGFMSPNWVNETVQQLQHYKVVQMFCWSQDLDPNYNPVHQSRGFMYGIKIDPDGFHKVNGGYGYGGKRGLGSMYHSGYAWAMRRSAWDDLGGLMDFCIAGQADNLMAHALVGQVEKCIYSQSHPAYRARALAWQWRANRFIDGNVGYVDGTIMHYWHGPKSNRGYQYRSRIITDNNFDPNTDIIYDRQGVLKLSGNKPKLRDQLMAYMRSRDEDSQDYPGRLIS